MQKIESVTDVVTPEVRLVGKMRNMPLWEIVAPKSYVGMFWYVDSFGSTIALAHQFPR